MYLKVEDIRNEFMRKYEASEFVIDKTGVKTLDIISASFLADEPYIIRQPNHGYIKREIYWYLSQSLNVNDIPPPTPKIWEQVADSQGFINSNYGYLIFSKENHNQYKNVVAELNRNPNSRRAVMIYNRPSIWYEYDVDGRSDFICTNAVQYVIRNGRLNAVVQMRSCDAIFGYNNDFAWQRYVLKTLSDELKKPIGDIYWQCGSLHVYERHFNLIHELLK